jgi:hypothetical protein
LGIAEWKKCGGLFLMPGLLAFEAPEPAYFLNQLKLLWAVSAQMESESL